MSENNQNQNNSSSSNEIDLGDLFRMIGRGIQKVFDFFRNVVLFILHLIVRTLLIIRQHILKFIVVGVLSAAIGLFKDMRNPSVFASNMIVETNFSSAPQFYSSIQYYNTLVEDMDSTKLAKIFGINKDMAGAIFGFYIEPRVNENELLSMYNEFIKRTDTAVTKYTNFDRYVDNLVSTDFVSHKITVSSFNKDIFPLLQDSLIVRGNLENEFIQAQKEIQKQNLIDREARLKAKQETVNNWKEVYGKVLISESSKTNSAQTNIQMAANTVKTNEMELFKLESEITRELIEINKLKTNNDNTVNVIKDFSRGYEIKNFFDSFLFKIPLVAVSLLFLFILLRELNKYLNIYQENKRLNV